MQSTHGRISISTRWAVAALLLLGVGMAVWGQAAVDVYELPAALKVELQRLRWEEKAIRELEEQPVDWSRFEARHARLLATALQYAGGAEGGIGPQAQARAALEICTMIRQMESLGYGEIAVARAVFAGVRTSLREMAASGPGEGDGELGDRIRSGFRHELRIQTAEQTRVQVRERVRVEDSEGPDGPAIGPGPDDPPGRS